MENTLQSSVGRPLSRGLPALAVATALLLTGCLSTAPKLGENKGTVSGAAGGETAENANSQLEKCEESLGTIAVQEDTNAPWYFQLRERQLGSTVPVIRLMIQQSNCFVVVERGAGMNNMMAERNLEKSGEMRGGSNFGGGQMVSADYTLRPEIQFSGKTGGGGGFLGGGALGLIGAVAGQMGKNEASTTLLLIDNRSGVQISASEGTGSNYDFGLFGAAFTGGLGGGGGGYSKTPQGKVIVSAFADSYNQMVKSLRSYKAQTVKGGLGTGGRLGVDGGTTPASKELAAPAPATKVPAAAVKPVTTTPVKKPAVKKPVTPTK